ncbi:ABC transporter ATP-binding protein [Rhizobium sp.]|uniref:ABC transporter ATP-binding protein n=1 Tax=Rhizobium sp. TaxID=391 RepID=UPI0034C6A1EE
MTAVNVENLNVSLRDGTAIVKDISFSIRAGEVMGLVGESGSGKSTIARALLGFASGGSVIRGGKVVIGGQDILGLNAKAARARRGKLVSYVPQDAGISLNPALSIGLQLTERLRTGEGALSNDEALQRVREVLDAVHLPSDRAFLKRYPSELSGGQLQRIGFAAAVVGRPKLLVLDEPTTALDNSTRSEVLNLVSQMNRDLGICSIYVSHDLGVISSVADQVMVLYAGRLMEYAKCKELFETPAHPYSRALLSAVPSSKERRNLVGIPGMAPSIKSRSAGCTFAARCPVQIPECLAVEPEPKAVGTRSVRCLRPFERSAERNFIEPPVHTEYDRTVLTVSGLTARYGDRVVLRDIGFEVGSGECVALVGESGSGKSTLSRCIIGLHSNFDGIITANGMPLAPDVRRRSRDGHRALQYIFQDPYASLQPRRTVGESIAVAFKHFFPQRQKDADTEVRSALNRAGLAANLASRFPNELSGGERQRVAIARALICKPDVLICDEATSALDVSVQATIVELLRQLMSDGLGILFVTHDLAVVRSLADRVIVLDKGTIADAENVEELFSRPKALYTKTLLKHTLDAMALVD